MKNKLAELTKDEMENIQIIFEYEIDDLYARIKKEERIDSGDLQWLANLQEILYKINYQIKHGE